MCYAVALAVNSGDLLHASTRLHHRLQGKPRSSVSHLPALKKRAPPRCPVLPAVQEYAILEPERIYSQSHEELQKKEADG